MIPIPLKPDRALTNLIQKSNPEKSIRNPRSMGKTGSSSNTPDSSQLFISALLLNFPNNLAGGTHEKAQSGKLKAQNFFISFSATFMRPDYTSIH
jgi:hypothetical protein